MRRLARWEPVTSVWVTQESHLCGHSDVYSETWPNSGMTLRGQAYELPTWEPLMDGSASSSSPGLPMELLGTPRVTTSGMTPSQAGMDRGEHNSRLEAQIGLLSRGVNTRPRSADGRFASADQHPTPQNRPARAERTA